MKKAAILFLMFFVGMVGYVQAQMMRWVFPGKQINFTNPSIPSVENLLPNTADFVARNAATDDNGNLLFHIIGRKLYPNSGPAIDFSTDYLPCEAEIAIVPVPAKCRQYYVIFCDYNNPGVPPYSFKLKYIIVDASGPNAVISVPPTLLLTSSTSTSSRYAGIAVSKIIPGTGNRFLYFVNQVGETIVTRFDITPYLIGYNVPVATNSTAGLPGPYYDGSPGNIPVGEASEVDLSPDGTKLAWVSARTPRVIFLNLNPTTGTLISASYKNVNGGSGNCYGVEWNAASTIAYISHFTTGLRYVTYSSLTDTLIALSSNYNRTQLEMGRNGKIFAVKNDASFGVINTSTNVVESSTLPITSALKDYFGRFYLLPDQVDGENYANITFPPVAIENTWLCVTSLTAPSNICTLRAIPSNYLSGSYYWERKLPGGAWISMPGNSSTNTDASTFNTTRQYRVRVIVGLCASAYSPVATCNWVYPGVCPARPEGPGLGGPNGLVGRSENTLAETQPATLSINPNPSNGIFELAVPGEAVTIAFIRVYNADGKQVKYVTTGTGKGRIKLDCSDLGNGIYFIETTTSTKEKHRSKIVIQK